VFSITTEQRQYTTYILRDEQASARLEVVPERGGIVTRWAVGDRDLLYLDEARFADPSLSIRGGIPILFPICGNLPNDSYTHNGQTYNLKQHGFARNLPWAVVTQSTENQASLTLELTSSDQTRPFYPFDFQLRFSYRLQGNTLTIHQEVTNLGPTPMPFSLGLHPYFQAADKNALQFTLPAAELRSQQDGQVQAFTGHFDLEQPEIDVLFAELSGQQATVVDSSQGTTLTLDYAAPYTMLVFWTLKEKDFYCLEPWTAARNALNTGDRLIHLDPDTTMGTTVRLTTSTRT
jgi:galactose mutarotase-like enzyme